MLHPWNYIFDYHINPLLHTPSTRPMSSNNPQPSTLSRPYPSLLGKKIHMTGLDMSQRQFTTTPEYKYQDQTICQLLIHHVCDWGGIYILSKLYHKGDLVDKHYVNRKFNSLHFEFYLLGDFHLVQQYCFHFFFLLFIAEEANVGAKYCVKVFYIGNPNGKSFNMLSRTMH